MMKKILLIIITFSFLLLSCKKDLEKEFANPEVNPNTGSLFPGMWTKMLYSWKLYVQDYGEWWWDIAGTGAMGVAGYTQVGQRYITDRYAWFSQYDDLTGTNGFGSEGKLWNERLGSFYTNATNWGVIKDNLALVTGQELNDNQIYFSLATILKDYGALISVDFYNSIPYTEAFQGKEKVFFPKYDDPKSIYRTCLDNFKKIAEELPSLYSKMSTSGKAIFTQQDIAMGGDVNKWVQYINAIRLKFAVRLSGVDEQFAKTHIQDLLTKNNFPTVDMTWKMPEPHDVKNGGTWLRGLTEGWPGTFIVNTIMKRMNKDTTLYQPGIDDPRLPVLALPIATTKYDSVVKVGVYVGVSMNADGQKPAYVGGERYYTGGPLGDLTSNLKQNYRSMYNFATFQLNKWFPVYMMSRAELDLFLAEVSLKNLATTPKSAGEYIKDAVTRSVDFWYYINSLNTEALVYSDFIKPAKPSATIINQYATSLQNDFDSKANIEDKMEILMQQKYIHLNIMCPYELWAELRRTRHPLLEPMTFQTKVMKPLPERLRYPTSEQLTNTTNYQTVKAQDNFTTPIFWVPDTKKTVIPYKNDYSY